MIAQEVVLKNAIVQEIGTGNGGHAEQLLERGVFSIELVDIDPIAVSLLQKLFATHKSVGVKLEDGFKSSSGQKFDVVVCMYSVATQRCTNITCLIQRIENVFNRLNSGGFFVFETIDYDVSKIIYPHGYRTCIFKSGDNTVAISSEYFQSDFQISYEGRLGGNEISYQVRIMRATALSIKHDIEERLDCCVSMRALDSDSRRILVVVKKP